MSILYITGQPAILHITWHLQQSKGTVSSNTAHHRAAMLDNIACQLLSLNTTYYRVPISDNRQHVTQCNTSHSQGIYVRQQIACHSIQHITGYLCQTTDSMSLNTTHHRVSMSDNTQHVTQYNILQGIYVRQQIACHSILHITWYLCQTTGNISSTMQSNGTFFNHHATQNKHSKCIKAPHVHKPFRSMERATPASQQIFFYK